MILAAWERSKLTNIALVDRRIVPWCLIAPQKISLFRGDVFEEEEEVPFLYSAALSRLGDTTC